MKIFIIYFVLLCCGQLAMASNFVVAPAPFQLAPDQPDTDETFTGFFARITRGGGFRGIYLQAPEKTQSTFLKTIRQGFWVGKRDSVMKELKLQGVDIWNDWYQQQKPFSAILNSIEKKTAFADALKMQIENDRVECNPHCPLVSIILDSSWKDLDSFSRQEFAKTMAFSKTLFSGKSIVDRLAEIYQFPASIVQSSTRIRILSNVDFITAVRDLDYQGPIYFRGITAPDPHSPGGHIVLLNQELIYKNSPFDSELLKTLEIVGILVHELSHVFQDLKGQSLGLDIQVRSPEAALIIEGSAEFLAEQAMIGAASSESAPSALKLFVAEQAVEIVYRPGNESTGQLFPYTVGLPFAAALYLQNESLQVPHQDLTEKILQFLGGQQALSDWLLTLQ